MRHNAVVRVQATGGINASTLHTVSDEQMTLSQLKPYEEDWAVLSVRRGGSDIGVGDVHSGRLARDRHESNSLRKPRLAHRQGFFASRHFDNTSNPRPKTLSCPMINVIATRSTCILVHVGYAYRPVRLGHPI